PLSGVTVAAEPLRQRPVTAGETVISALDGRFTVVLAPPARPRDVRLRFLLEGYAPELVRPGPDAGAHCELEDVVLSRGARVFGHVVASDGRALEGVAVSLRPVDGKALQLLDDPLEHLGPHPSDAAGRFTFDDLPAGSYTLRAVLARHQVHDDHARFQVDAGATHDLGTIALLPGDVLRGRVITPDRRPLPDADVRVRFAPSSGSLRVLGHTRTGADGTFAVDH